ncbi:hypothetical protein AVEN_7386-1 [Araneus ventricosus]|uniref:Uncharacterized protein n=1 Tax=Araneus ventricosus TaxID=182803 RepID=A0A4Y2BQD4_ARAVE|nr:hypothetical protein AVEN_7386-1 [Araneus ventricosus]
MESEFASTLLIICLGLSYAPNDIYNALYLWWPLEPLSLSLHFVSHLVMRLQEELCSFLPDAKKMQLCTICQRIYTSAFVSSDTHRQAEGESSNTV